jgi:D-alanyl-D-alanine carboxypeptidase (penicillin-binding protein 5/6)
MKQLQFFKKYSQKICFVYIPLFLVFIFVFIFFVNVVISLAISTNRTNDPLFEVSKEAKIPIIKTLYDPNISAKGAIIMDADSRVVLYSKNPNLRFSTASTAKIMTALTALDYFDLQDVLVVKQATNEGSVLGLIQGDQLTFENLLYAMLLPSANDAALTISQNYPNGEESFVVKMNDKAKDFDLYNTHYSDTAGLHDSGDYTTPFDLARLASFAIKNETLKKIVGTKDRFIYTLSGNVYEVSNLNKLLGIDGVTGIKTGYTEEAGQVLVTSREQDGKTIIIVVMGSEDRFTDTEKLLDLVRNNVTYLSIHP